MPSKPPRYCPRCATAHAAQCPARAAQHRPSTAWRTGSTRRWRKLRAAQLAAHPLCQWRACRALAAEVDHITPLSRGGERYDPGNLQSLCRRHHAHKTRAEQRHTPLD